VATFPVVYPVTGVLRLFVPRAYQFIWWNAFGDWPDATDDELKRVIEDVKGHLRS
jgi:hypothetical protein